MHRKCQYQSMMGKTVLSLCQEVHTMTIGSSSYLYILLLLILIMIISHHFIIMLSEMLARSTFVTL